MASKGTVNKANARQAGKTKAAKSSTKTSTSAVKKVVRHKLTPTQRRLRDEKIAREAGIKRAEEAKRKLAAEQETKARNVAAIHQVAAASSIKSAPAVTAVA